MVFEIDIYVLLFVFLIDKSAFIDSNKTKERSYCIWKAFPFNERALEFNKSSLYVYIERVH